MLHNENELFQTNGNHNMGDFGKWLLDSGATSHFTPEFNDLIEVEKLQSPLYIKVADRSRLKATHKGVVILRFKSDQEILVNLKLLRVLYVPGLQTRLFSIESFISDGKFSALYQDGQVKLSFDNTLSISIALPHVPRSTFVARENTSVETGFCTEVIDRDDITNNSSDDNSLPDLLDRFDDDSSDDESETGPYYNETIRDPEDVDRDILCLPCCTINCCPSHDSIESNESTVLTEINELFGQTSIDNIEASQLRPSESDNIISSQIHNPLDVGTTANTTVPNNINVFNETDNANVARYDEHEAETGTASDDSHDSTPMYEAYANENEIESTTSSDDTDSSFDENDNEFNNDYHWTEYQNRPQLPPSSSEEENAAMARIDATDDNVDNNHMDPMEGGDETIDTWRSTLWNEEQLKPDRKQRMTVELAHKIFGHRSVLSLVKASKANVWDDLNVVFTHDSWCGSCSIGSIQRSQMSKRPSRMIGLPLQHMYIDCVPSPGILRGVKNCTAKDFILICDPISKFVDKLNLKDKSSKSVIEVLQTWRGEMLEKGFELFIYLRSDAGSNFTSHEFKTWCRENHIKLTIAGPRHQEQNGFVKTTYKTLGRMARSMLIALHLPIQFYHLAMDYACLILRVLPQKGLKNENGEPVTTYQVLHNKKPRIRRFRVFGCPVVFKRYKPQHAGDHTTTFQQLQRGSRGIFVGFPRNQAGWLIYVPEKIGGHHLIVSMDVVFDQHFMSTPVGSNTPYAGAQTERPVGRQGGRLGSITEATGNITNITDTSVSHWGNDVTFDSDHQVIDNTGERTTDVDVSTNNDITNDDEVIEEHIIEDTPDDIGTQFDTDTQTENDEDDNNTTPAIQDESEPRRSTRASKRPSRLNVASSQGQTYGDGSIMVSMETQDYKNEFIGSAFAEIESIFTLIDQAAELLDIPIAPYLPEPKGLKNILALPPAIQQDWLKTVKKEMKFLIENETFKKDKILVEGDEIIPAMIIFKAKVTSRGFLDKLKARCVARGDLQAKSGDPDELWSPCVFARTFKVFVAEAVKRQKRIKQLDYVGAFCQGFMQKRLFIQLPREYGDLLPEYREYFKRPLLIQKSLYGTDIAAKVWNHDLTKWLTTNDNMRFHQSTVDPSLYVHRGNNDRYLYMIIYVDDSLYFGSDVDMEQSFEKYLGERFKIDILGWSHWFLGTRLYQEEDGSYLLDQENYIRHVLNRYCGKETIWGLPRMQSTPAPIDYIYTKENRPSTEEEKETIKKRFKGLSMPSAVSSLLYAALNTRCDILWITNKLAKSCSNPGIADYEALLHVFGYLRKFPDYAIKFYANAKESPVFNICDKNNIETTSIIGFSDASWQDCPDTGRSTCGYKIFIQGGLIDAQSTLPVPVALSSAEAEYMGACGLGAMICHLRELQYEFEALGTKEYDENKLNADVPSILLIDNQATVRMSKNYKLTKKNRHIRRRWHFVRYGVQQKLFTLKWIKAEDQLADDCTKTQSNSVSEKHFKRTLMQIPDKVKGFKSNTVGNR